MIMAISEATIQELKQVLKEDYGKDVNQAEASEILRALVSYYDLLAKIHHREKTQNNYENDKSTNNREF